MTRNKKNQDTPEAAEASVGKRSDRPLSPDLQAHIGVRLKAFYDSVLSEPVPDRFTELLDQLDSAGKAPPDANTSRDSGGGHASMSAARDVKAAGGDVEADLNGGSDSDVRQ